MRRTLAFSGLVACVALLVSVSLSAATSAAPATKDKRSIQHVLLLSIDGIHAVDLARYVQHNPGSALASLSNVGVTYTAASTAKPSDSFPGLLSMITGGSPRSTGVYYDDSYDKSLSPPGSNCATVGTEVAYDESIDKDPDALNGGGGIDPATLPLDPNKGCTPVYPHSFLRVNTIFEVAKAAGRRTAWSDKHPSYELVNGPSGKGVDDLYVPEIASTCPLAGSDGANTSSVPCVKQYDDLKVAAVLHQIDGTDHTGAAKADVPAIFGMNFQAVSVAQKLAGVGYADTSATPSAGLLDAMNHTDQSIGAMVRELQAKGLLDSTLIVVTAKHGQAPIDPSKRQIVDSKLIPSLINSVQPGLLAQATQDDVGLYWLTNSAQTPAVVAKLAANQAQAGIQEILSGEALKLHFSDPLRDPRAPDLVVLPNMGVIYTKPTGTKIAEHGGFSDQDTNVALLVANPRLARALVPTAVQTTQIAPTILSQLGLDPQALSAVRLEQTPLLPGLALK